MAVQMREPVTTQTPCSAFVEAGAVRLFCAGYLGKLRFNQREDDHWYYTLPSESELGVLYQLDYCPTDGTIRCSCPAGQNNVPCKHVRLFQLLHGWAVREAAA